MSVYTPKEWGKIKQMFARRNSKRPAIKLNVKKVKDNDGCCRKNENDHQILVEKEVKS